METTVADYMIRIHAFIPPVPRIRSGTRQTEVQGIGFGTAWKFRNMGRGPMGVLSEIGLHSDHGGPQNPKP